MVPNFLFDVQEGPRLSNKLSFYSEQLIFGKRQLLQFSLRCCKKWMTFLKWTFDLLVPNFLFDVQEGRRQTYKVYFHSEQLFAKFTEHLTFHWTSSIFKLEFKEKGWELTFDTWTGNFPLQVQLFGRPKPNQLWSLKFSKYLEKYL